MIDVSNDQYMRSRSKKTYFKDCFSADIWTIVQYQSVSMYNFLCSYYVHLYSASE